VTFDVATCRAYLRARQEQQVQVREQRRQAALQAVRAAARSVLPRFPGVRRAYLFGSVLRPGAMRSASYVDLAVEGNLNAEDYFALWRELERATGGWPVDLVELDRELRFAAHVRERGELVYACTERSRSERSDSDVEGRR
jgi:predicted nucleotidyltransferase